MWPLSSVVTVKVKVIVKLMQFTQSTGGRMTRLKLRSSGPRLCFLVSVGRRWLKGPSAKTTNVRKLIVIMLRALTISVTKLRGSLCDNVVIVMS